MTTQKPKIGVSACLIGQEVRFNGGHAEDRYVSRTLSDMFELVPVCPEVEMGLSVPREPIRMVQRDHGIHLMGVRSGEDHTDKMNAFITEYFFRPEIKELHGMILMKKSPSCGLSRVPIYDDKGNKVGRGGGLFAEAVKRFHPSLPLEDSGRLNDIGLRENFVERVYANQDWKQMMDSGPTKAKLVQFHTRYKLMLMAHEQNRARELGRLVGKICNTNMTSTLMAYAELFMECMSIKASNKGHANALYHLVGYFKDKLASEDKHELTREIERYRTHNAPLSVPLTLFNHYQRKYPHPWVAKQTYLDPYPESFLMRQHL